MAGGTIPPPAVQAASISGTVGWPPETGCAVSRAYASTARTMSRSSVCRRSRPPTSATNFGCRGVAVITIGRALASKPLGALI